MQDDKALAFARCINKNCKHFGNWHLIASTGARSATWREVDQMRRNEPNRYRLI
jgi:hypothetical protein